MSGPNSVMKQLSSETHDASTLQELGRASVQIVHDLKNQLNGLKLYATFLRKRMESSDRPADELETIGKLIAGLERAASDMTTLVRYGRPVELRQIPTDLLKIVNGSEKPAYITIESEGAGLSGEFDVAAMMEALGAITAYATRPASSARREDVRISLARDAERSEAVVEWQGIKPDNGDDPFQSLARGEGVRMALARKIIEAHGGHAESDATVLRVRLPLKQQT